MSDLSKQMLAAQIDALSPEDKSAFGLAEAKIASAEELRGAIQRTIETLAGEGDTECLSMIALWFLFQADLKMLKGFVGFIDDLSTEDN